MRQKTSFRILALSVTALAVTGLVGAAGIANAAVVRTKDILPGCGTTTGCDISGGVTVTFTAGDEYVLDGPIFVRDGVLDIEPGVVVRGQPRYAGVVAGVTRGTPGVIIVTRDGEIDADGEVATSSIILTTAAVDNDADGVADDFDGNGFEDQYPGFVAACANGGSPTAPEGPDNLLGTGDDDLGSCVIDATPAFLDDSPASAPLAPLNSEGSGNVALWGGVVLLGSAPMNTLGATTTPGTVGTLVVEGLPVPGYPEENATCGGQEPHDSSGTMRYVSVRHAGDEIGSTNELNGVTLCAVGDGTTFEFNEVYANFDDGFEWFGGTVNTNHLSVAFIGDDSTDFDQGHTGVHQFIVSFSTFFNQFDGESYGSASGDKAGEWDGEDCNGDCNLAGPLSFSPTGGALDFGPLPVSSAFVYNYTSMGNALDVLDAGGALITTPEYDPNSQLCDGDPDTVGAGEPACCNIDNSPDPSTEECTAANNEGIEMRAGFAGELRNSYIVNTGSEEGLDIDGGGAAGWTTPENICADTQGADGFGDLVRVVTSTFDDTRALEGPGDCSSGGAGGDDADALANGDAISAGVNANPNLNSNIYNDVITRTGGPAAGGGARGFVNEDLSFDPTGACAGGKLGDCLKTAGAGDINPRPSGAVGFQGAISAGAQPVADPASTFRGAFPASGPLWTTGWTVLSIADMLVQ